MNQGKKEFHKTWWFVGLTLLFCFPIGVIFLVNNNEKASERFKKFTTWAMIFLLIIMFINSNSKDKKDEVVLKNNATEIAKTVPIENNIKKDLEKKESESVPVDNKSAEQNIQETKPIQESKEIDTTKQETKAEVKTTEVLKTEIAKEEPKKSEIVEEKKEISVLIQYSANMISNDHIGNEWSYNISCNGDTLNPYGKTTITINESMKTLLLEAVAVENDKIPDVGREDISVNLEELIKNKSLELNKEVTVRENRGRYSGNTATWLFNIKVTLN